MFDMENNASSSNDSHKFYNTDVVAICRPLHEYLGKSRYLGQVRLLDDNDFKTLGNLENRLPANSTINECTGIGHSINITNGLPHNDVSQHVVNSVIVIVCLLGLRGTGRVIWLLGFRLKKNPYTTYILNLSIADSGVLISLIPIAIFGIVETLCIKNYMFCLFFQLFLHLYLFAYCTSQFLLAAISTDRCVAVLFPLWHRCHRPPSLSTIVCALIWILSFLLCVIHFTLRRNMERKVHPRLFFQLIVLCFLLCTPLMVVSTLTLFIHICCKSKQHQQGKLVNALLFFLILAFPMNALYVIYSYYISNESLMVIGFACASLNSSTNPLIYFLVGSRQKKVQCRMSMQVALQRVFNDEQDFAEEQNPNTETRF